MNVMTCPILTMLHCYTVHMDTGQSLPETRVSCLHFYLVCPYDFNTKVSRSICILFFGISLDMLCCYYFFVNASLKLLLKKKNIKAKRIYELYNADC